MLNIAICDDEKTFAEGLKKNISKYMKEKGIDTTFEMFTSGEDLLDLGIGVNRFRIIFLDINMQQMNGLETAKAIRKMSSDIYIVFITACMNYVLDGYKVDAVRYLLKGNEDFNETLIECMDAICNKMGYVKKKKRIDFKGGALDVSLNRVLYIESKLHKLEFHVMEEELKIYTVYNTMNNIEEEYKEEGFIRIHQSYMVNMMYIKDVRKFEVELLDGTVLVVPRARYDKVREQFILYRGNF